MTKRIVVHVFLGGENSVQSIPFAGAKNEAIKHLVQARYEQFYCHFEEINVCMIKELGWGPQQLVDWLLCSDVHFILSHVHQGMSALGESQMGWNMLLLQKQLMRLRDHRGYPNGDKLLCPIFLQDKLY